MIQTYVALIGLISSASAFKSVANLELEEIPEINRSELSDRSPALDPEDAGMLKEIYELRRSSPEITDYDRRSDTAFGYDSDAS